MSGDRFDDLDSAGELDEGREEIDERNVRRATPSGESLGPGDHQRDPGRGLEERSLVPQAALAQEVSVVGREHHDRVAGEPRILQR